MDSHCLHSLLLVCHFYFQLVDSQLFLRFFFLNDFRILKQWPSFESNTGWRMKTEGDEQTAYGKLSVSLEEIKSRLASFYYPYNLALFKHLGKEYDWSRP